MPDEVRDLDAVVSVEEVLKGSAPEGTVTVKTPKLAYSGPGDAEWRRPGEGVLLFLSRSRERDTRGLYIVAGISYEQAAYLRRADELCATREDPLSDRIASLSVPELRRKIEEAKGEGREGRGEAPRVLAPKNPIGLFTRVRGETVRKVVRAPSRRSIPPPVRRGVHVLHQSRPATRLAADSSRTVWERGSGNPGRARRPDGNVHRSAQESDTRSVK